jgi:hypothetical protein
MRGNKAKGIGFASVILAALAIALVNSARSAQAIGNPEDKTLFGPVGITRFDVLRVNVHVIGDPNEIIDPNQRWEFEVKFLDAAGTLVKVSRFRVAPGTSRRSDLFISDEEYRPAPDRYGRHTFRVEIVGFNPQPDPPGRYAATLEVFDARTGLTRLLLGGPDTVPASPRDQ